MGKRPRFPKNQPDYYGKKERINSLTTQAMGSASTQQKMAANLVNNETNCGHNKDFRDSIGRLLIQNSMGHANPESWSCALLSIYWPEIYPHS